MSKRAIRYAVVDAFTKEAFKGGPAAVCLLEENADVDKHWMQSVASEFNFSATAFISRVISAVSSNGHGENSTIPRFNLCWFTPVAEVILCGHATLGTAHFLFASYLAEHDTIEFVSKSGLLVARKIIKPKHPLKEEKFTVELDFPVHTVVGCDTSEFPSIPLTLNSVPIINVMKTTPCGDFIVELPSGKEVAELQPNIREIKECAGRGIIVTGTAPEGTGFDFFTRFFCPKLGIDEDPVCGSIHSALVLYWHEKLKKKSLTSFMASPRSAILNLELDEKNQRMRISGEAVTVMVGTMLV